MFDISRLYELSLAIGESVDLRENCEGFLSELLPSIHHDAASVWLDHRLLAGGGPESGERAEDVVVLIKGEPAGRYSASRIPLDHPLLAALSVDPVISVCEGDEAFPDVKIDRGIHRGVVTVFGLGKAGFLHMHAEHRLGPLTPAEQSELRRVVGKFATSLEASLAHHALIREMALRRRAETSLHHREERFRELIENGLDLILVLAYDGTVTFASPSVRRALGHETADVTGNSFFELLHPDEVSDHFRDFLERVRCPGVLPPVEMRFRHRDGSWRTFVVSTNNLLTIPSVEGIIMNCHDITERKAWTLELDKARRAAVDASRAKSDFVANMSHEIRNPLNGVIGMASILLETELSLEQRDCASTIRVSADTLLTIIEDILDLSRIESGKLELTTEAFSVFECVEGCLDMVAPSAAAKELDLACVLEEGAADHVLGDGIRFRQVLLNLLSNAVKFTAAGDVLVRVSSREIDNEELEVSLSVRDTGIGIAAEHGERLFEQFSQADASTTRTYGGAGLGLAISKRLCELMGGRIWFESEAGEGATFFFTIRCRAQSAMPDTEASPDFKGKTCCVVDPSDAVRLAITGVGERLGLEIAAAEDLGAVLEALVDGPGFDAVVLSSSLVRNASGDHVQRLRNDLTGTPVVVLRSLGEDVTDLDLPIAARVSKPVKHNQLARALVRVLLGDEVAPRTVEPAVEPVGIPAGLRVLLAEDDVTSRRVAEMMLDRLGCRFEVVGDGEAAVESVLNGDFEMVFMDIQMPGIDGLEATRRIRSEFDGTQPRIIAMTAHATSEDRQRCFAAGMDSYISKPIHIERLREMVRALSGTEVRVEESVLDSTRIQALLQTGGKAMLSDIAAIYLDDLPGFLQLLEHAAEASDFDAVVEVAHKIRGSSSNLGAVDVAARAAALEDTAREMSIEEVKRAIEGLRAACAAAKRDLCQFAM